MNAIELTNVNVTFGTGYHALVDLNLRVPSGTIFGFLGVNGAGKTTTIRAIAGLRRPEGGSIRLFGEEITPGESGHLFQVGFVLDEPMYFEWMTPSEYWRFAGGMYHLDPPTVHSRVVQLLDFLELEDKKDDLIATLSTGMKKKVSLGAALIHRPRLIVLDEPLEGIDALAANAIKSALTLAAAQGTTVFMTSHVLDTVERFCTEIAVLHKGAIVLQCRTDEVTRQALALFPGRRFTSLEELFLTITSPERAGRSLGFLLDEHSA
jgi:ABC-2 type transport system ATP-binding protein